jgi:hypothetical protein
MPMAVIHAPCYILHGAQHIQHSQPRNPPPLISFNNVASHSAIAQKRRPPTSTSARATEWLQPGGSSVCNINIKLALTLLAHRHLVAVRCEVNCSRSRSPIGPTRPGRAVRDRTTVAARAARAARSRGALRCHNRTVGTACCVSAAICRKRRADVASRTVVALE